MSEPGDFQGMNKYQVYRKIRSDRAYRTLGKMSVWRVVIGTLLLVLVLFVSGAVSESFAARGSFKTAEALMIAPGWMEKYRPNLTAYIEAGVLYQSGEYESACAAFDTIEDYTAADSMAEASRLQAARQALDSGDAAGARALALSVDETLLTEELQAEYALLLEALPEN